MIIPADAYGVARAVQALRDGRCIGLPTETVYGLAADGLNPQAVAQIFEIKQRPHFDPLILHLATPEAADQVASTIPPHAHALIDHFWPGPLTLVLPRRQIVPDLVTSGLETVAVRCPAHPVAREVLRQFQGPLAAPSANPFGRLSPTNPAAVEDELGPRLALVLDGGPCACGIESTIIDCTYPTPALLRHGAISREEIESVCGPLRLATGGEALKAPGLLAHHYAPRRPLWLLDQPYNPNQPLPIKTALLTWHRPPADFTPHRVLAPDGSTRTAATRLFALLRELDCCGAERLVAEPVPPDGLGPAIADRLLRASSGRLHWNGRAWDEIPRPH